MPETSENARLEQHRAEMRRNRKRSRILAMSLSRGSRDPLDRACVRIEALDRSIRRAMELISQGDLQKASEVLSKAQAPGRYSENRPLSSEAQELWNDLESKRLLCPIWSRWHDLWLSLPNKYPSLSGDQWHPPEPCDLKTWKQTTHQFKHDLLLHHIRWADQNHALKEVKQFLMNLPEDAWVYCAPEGSPDSFIESLESFHLRMCLFAMHNNWEPEFSSRAEELVYFVHRHKYLCPNPASWNEMSRLLPESVETDQGENRPPVPLILGGWYASSDEDKNRRLLEQIFWADKFGRLIQIDQFLRKLAPGDWYQG